jgi:DNA-directed RNA polymerase sigma subunit (sigma70/sigma32)
MKCKCGNSDIRECIIFFRDFDKMTYEEIASQVGLSREKVRQIYNKFKFKEKNERIR